MGKIIMLCGMPGSGKSTYAKDRLEPKGFKILSSDQLRLEIMWKYFKNFFIELNII